jgi:hypothetical protein
MTSDADWRVAAAQSSLSSPAHPQLVVGIGTVVGVLLISAPATAAGWIAVAPSTARAGSAVVVYEAKPTTESTVCPIGDEAVPTSAGGAFRVCYTVPNSAQASSYRISVRCGGVDMDAQATAQVTAKVTHAPTGAPQTEPGTPGRSMDPARWWEFGGASLIGIASFLGAAQWHPKRRRRM